MQLVNVFQRFVNISATNAGVDLILKDFDDGTIYMAIFQIIDSLHYASINCIKDLKYLKM